MLGGLGFEHRRPGRAMPRLILAWCLLACLALLGACSGPVGLAGKAVGAALGGGPQVAANVQAGKANAQVLGRSQINEQKLLRPRARTIEQSAGETAVRAEAVQSVTVRNGVPSWILLLALGAAVVAGASLSDEIRGLLARRKKREGRPC
ncbi:hypothetical protein ETW23_03950 [Leisingera sp. NJS201]|uniref:bacteriophage spanin2 family protein n=1 Tax=Leisingera sp. NJS201 TaxID=2508306 RepID=UPI001070CEBF|nr:bacteriophage spanin2 family protein [Leisingera sp. NJS201]QBR35419.1 hypothetical protein ETW23_03950 [Leisingera sp. NJS201]